MSDDLARNYTAILKTLGAAKLLAVSKRQSIEKIENLYALGQHAFGENYVQEGVEKIQALHDKDIEWHFIGQIQSNKTRLIAENFQWVQSLDRLKIAERLQQHCLSLNKSLEICIAVNIDAEPQKGGVLPENLVALAQGVAQCSQLRLRGIMAIPAVEDDSQKQFAIFEKVHDLFLKLNHQGFNCDTLSMGMSHDYQQAIRAGSTMVRIGASLFGTRK